VRTAAAGALVKGQMVEIDPGRWWKVLRILAPGDDPRYDVRPGEVLVMAQGASGERQSQFSRFTRKTGRVARYVAAETEVVVA
jgi:hypothetical protein